MRSLLRSPGFTAAAVLTLALGIGFNTALFTIVDAVLLRPLPVERPNELVNIYTSGRVGTVHSTSSYQDYLDFRARNAVLKDILAFSPSMAAIRVGDRTRLALGEVVTGNYFGLLGVNAAVGRTLQPSDDRPGATRAAMISSAFWNSEFNSDPAVLGKTIRVRAQVYTIVGVAPSSFTGMFPILRPEIWTSMVWAEDVSQMGMSSSEPSPGTTRLDRRGYRWLFVTGRLKDGVTVQQADADLRGTFAQLAKEYPQSNSERRVSVVSVRDAHILPEADGPLRALGGVLMLSVGFELLIACANVTSMLLARAAGRQREFEIRFAVGASRRRVIQYLLTESVILTAAGSLAGVALGWMMMRGLSAIRIPTPVPLVIDLNLDPRVVWFTLAISAFAALFAGLAPALRATRTDIVSEVKGQTSSIRTRRRRWTTRDILVVGQIAATFLLLVMAGYNVRSLIAAQKLELGFAPEGLASILVDPGMIGYDAAKKQQFYERAIERIRGIPGVQSVTIARRLPLALDFDQNTILVPGVHAPTDKPVATLTTTVTPEYFATLGVSIVRGRNFSAADTLTSSKVAIVNQAMARKYWPGQDSIGKRFRVLAAEYEVVGAVSDYKVRTVTEAPTPYIHYPVAQRPTAAQVIIARTSGGADLLAAAMRRELTALDPDIISIDATMEEQVYAVLLPSRLVAGGASAVGLTALLLAAVGLYGLIAYSTARRTKEIGIRVALGSTPKGVLYLVTRQGLTLVSIGLALGGVLTVVVNLAVSRFLQPVPPADPLTWIVVVLVLAAASTIANVIPARRAARIDPATVLRTE